MARRVASRWASRYHRGIIKVLAPDELALADDSGDRQYISIGNLAGSDRIILLLLDDAERTRLRARGDRIDDDLRRWNRSATATIRRARSPMWVEAWDTNCSSQIPHLVPRGGIDG